MANGLYLNTEDSNKFFNDIDQNFITFLLQNNLSFIQDYQLTFENVMKGKESAANYIAKIKNDPRYKNNMFVKNLLPLINYKDSNIDNFRSFKGKGVTSFINEQSEAFDEIMDQDPNFGVLLLVGNVFQSGTYNSMFQLNKFLPYETQKVILSELNDVIDDIMSDKETRAENVNEFLHKFLLSHPQYIPEAWKFNPNNSSYDKIKMFPYALNSAGDIILVNNGVVTGKKVERIGNYQGIDYISDVPMTDNFMATDVIRPKLATKSIQPYTGVKKVISGGQTGIDQLGLIVGKKLGIKTGGTATPGFVTEKGKDLNLKSFGVEEISSELQAGKSGKEFYLPRTEQNVLNSDGTVYFATNEDSAGKIATQNFARKHNKPFILNPTAEELNKWLSDNNIETLNVAGNRGSKITDQEINDFSKILESGLSKPSEESDIFVPSSDLKKTNPYAVEPGVEPVTTDEGDTITLDNFDDFFPEYKDLSTNEKVQYLRGLNNDDLNKTCKIG